MHFREQIFWTNSRTIWKFLNGNYLKIYRPKTKKILTMKPFKWNTHIKGNTAYIYTRHIEIYDGALESERKCKNFMSKYHLNLVK